MICAGSRERGYLACPYGPGKTVRSLCVERDKSYVEVLAHVRRCHLCDPEEAVRAFHANRFHRPKPLFSSDLARNMVLKYIKDFTGHPYRGGGPRAFSSPASRAVVRDFHIFSRPEEVLEHLVDLTREEAGRVLMLNWRVTRDDARRVAKRNPGLSALWTPHLYGVLKRSENLSRPMRSLTAMFEACLTGDPVGLEAVRDIVGESDFADLQDILAEALAAGVLQT